MEILTPFTGEMLVLAMLVVLNARIFFTRRTRRDALAMLAPLSLFVAVLEIFAWGLRVANIALFAVSLICTLLNYRSIVRFSQGLYVDSYSIRFFIASLFVLIVLAFMLAAAIIWRPVRLQTRKYNVEVAREYYSCVENELPKKSAEIYDKRNLTLYTFSNKDEAAQKDTAVLFVGDVLAETLSYEPYLILLARAGYTVLAADLYEEKISSVADLAKLKILRRFLLASEYIKSGLAFDKNANAARANDFAKIYENSYNALASIAKEKYSDKKLFVVCDSSSVLAQEKLDAIFSKQFSVSDARAFPRSLDLSSINEYSTPGFGFIAQTNPIFAKLFLGVERDKTSFAPSYCVYQTVSSCSEQGQRRREVEKYLEE